MYTKKQMLELIENLKYKTKFKDIRNYLDNINEEDRKFLLKYRLETFNNRDLENPLNLEKFCYDLSIDKILDNRSKKITIILNQ